MKLSFKDAMTYTNVLNLLPERNSIHPLNFQKLAIVMKRMPKFNAPETNLVSKRGMRSQEGKTVAGHIYLIALKTILR